MVWEKGREKKRKRLKKGTIAGGCVSMGALMGKSGGSVQGQSADFNEQNGIDGLRLD